MKLKLIKLESVNSTNDEAIKLIKNNKNRPSIITAKIQKKGKGTMGKKWISQMGNIFVSIFFEIRNDKIPFQQFSIFNAYLIKKILSKYSTVKINIKWPNDLLIKKKKICGILQEIISISGNKFQGIASQADALNDGGTTITASEFLRSNDNDTTSGSLGIVNDSGLTVGLDSDLRVYVVGTRVKIKNQTSGGDFEIEDNTTITGDLTVTGTLTSANSVSTAVSTLIVEDNLMVLNSTSSGLLPSGLVNYAGVQVNRGAGSAGAGPSSPTIQDVFWVFDETFADDGTTTYGNAGGAWSAFRSGNNLNDKTLVDIRANVFHGKATTSEYADLAENYTTDKEYPVGTVICVGGEHEATATTPGSMPIGVISDKPAYLMNSAGEGQAVALKGRVPVLIAGKIDKGDLVYVSSIDGTASKLADDGANLVGIALENNADNEVKLVECVLKV